jgi:Zn-dependent protease
VGRTGTWIWDLTTGSVSALVDIPGKIPDLLRDTAKQEERTADDGGPVSVVDVGRLSGQAFEARQFAAVLFLIASLNVFVGLFNMLPLLPLDGGHLAILAFESVRSRLYKAFGKLDPGRVDLARLMPLMVGFIVLMGSLTVVLLYAGITNPMANPFGTP